MSLVIIQFTKEKVVSVHRKLDYHKQIVWQWQEGSDTSINICMNCTSLSFVTINPLTGNRAAN